MKGTYHGTGDKAGELAPALVDVPKKQPGDNAPDKLKVPKRKRRKAPKIV